MLLTITTTHRPALDLGYLLHKHPEWLQSFDLSFGRAHVFYPEAALERCTACLLLDVDVVEMVRGKGRDQRFLLGHYVNDRPYTASSFMSVVTAQVFGSALNIDQQPCGFVFLSGQSSHSGGIVQDPNYSGRTIVASAQLMQGIAASGIGLIQPFPGLPTKRAGSFDELGPSFRAGFDKLASYMSGCLQLRNSS